MKHLNPGAKLFKYPDAKTPGGFKMRPPYTAWNQVGWKREQRKAVL